MPLKSYQGQTLPTSEWKCPACGNTNVHDVDDGCLHCAGTGKVPGPATEAARQGKMLDSTVPPADVVEQYLSSLSKARAVASAAIAAVPPSQTEHRLDLILTEDADGRATCELRADGHVAKATGESTLAAFAAAWERWQGPILPDAKLEEWLARVPERDPHELIDLFHEIARYVRLND